MTINNPRYAVNQQKQAELDSLTAQVTRAEYQVEQLTAIVNSLTTKQGIFAAQLSKAETDRTAARNNLDMVKQVVAGIKEMVRKAHTVRGQTIESNHSVQNAASQLSIMVNKLIFSIELLDKLTLLINKKQETRVVISADLVSTIAKANGDANSALALTLTALNSCFAAMSSGSESATITTLEYVQSIKLYGLVSGNTGPVNTLVANTDTLGHETDNLDKAKFNLLEAARAANYTDSLTDLSAGNTTDDINSVLTNKRVEANNILTKSTETHSAAIKALKNATDENANELAQAVSEAAQQMASDKDTVANLDSLIGQFANFVGVLEKYDDANTAFNESVQALNVTFAQFSQEAPTEGTSLYRLINSANNAAIDYYDYSLALMDKVNQELNQAQAGLVSADANLASLKAGLAAATAAALAA